MMRLAILLIVAALAGCADDLVPLQPEETDRDGVADPEEPVTVPEATKSVPLPTNSSMEPQWGDLNAPIRPGAPIGWCTYNFLFVAPENGTYYIGTAAHCTDGIGQRIPLDGMGEIGTVVYDSDNATSGAHADFSLIQLDEGLNLKANPAMMNRDGPVGSTDAGEVAVGDILEHHGYGLVFGNIEQTRDREGIFIGWNGGTGHDYCAESPVWWGDSGSPILHQATGTAFGIVSRAGWIECLPTAQLMGASLEYIFEELAKHGWNGVELATV